MTNSCRRPAMRWNEVTGAIARHKRASTQCGRLNTFASVSPWTCSGISRRRSRTDHEGPASGPFWDEKTPRMMLQSHEVWDNQPRPEAVVLGRPPEGAVYVRLPPLGAWSWSGPGFSQAPAEASPLMTNSRLIQCHARVLPSPDQNGKSTPDRSKLFGHRPEAVVLAGNKLPTDLSEQHDHYIYGTPKQPVE